MTTTNSNSSKSRCNTSNTVNDLVKQILNQRAVFFVGAGFSLDDENVSTKKIMASLLCRFLAMTEPSIIGANSALKSKRMACDQLFGLWLCGNETDKNKIVIKLNDNRTWFSSAVIDKFADKYYQVNEWMVKSYGELYQNYPRLIRHINRREKKIRSQLYKRLNKKQNKQINDYLVNRTALSYKFFSKLNGNIGKAIFIETVGLGNQLVMQSHRDKNPDVIRPRYHTFGKLACEGLSPIIVTTNYDLLIERGYQAVGLDIVDTNNHSEGSSHLPKCALSIRQPSDFFVQSSLNPAHILKVHGCAQTYREYKHQLLTAKTADELKTALKQFNEYLNSIIYTYREIQHWRDDAWSRDYLQTLLRTKSFVFCGYSAADPVMHVTIRNIYEEMERKEISKCKQNFTSPAFSTRGPTLEFDSLEILNAASKAIGKKPPPDTHDGFLQYHFGGNTFPSCDCVFRSILHRTSRQLQQQILKDHLETTVLTLFGKPKPKAEIDEIKQRFEHLVTEEIKQELNDSTPQANTILERHLGWTELFHQKVLKLFDKTKAQHYVSLRQNSVWSCFSILLELAIYGGDQLLYTASTKGDFVKFDEGDDFPVAYIVKNSQGPQAIVIADNSKPAHLIKPKLSFINKDVWTLDIRAGALQQQSHSSFDYDSVWQLALQ